jgi:large subunit ribosomal protein L25
MLTLNYTTRDSKIKPDELRKSGSVPAVFYGPKEKSTPVTLNTIDFLKTWKKAGESSIIVLKGPKGEEHEALIHDVDLHPVNDAPLHADFYVIEKGKKLSLDIPLEFTGVSAAVKDLGGTLVKVLHSIEIEALPKDLPHSLTVDISLLSTLESQILAKQITMPAGVTLITSAEDVVAAISVAKEEVEEPSKTLDDIEVVGAKGKEEVAEGEAAAGKPGEKAAADKGAKPAAKGAEKK